MKWETWKPRYEEIVKRLELDPEMDRKASEILSDIITESDISEMREKIEGKECIIFGAGPSLEEDLERLDEEGWLGKKVLIATDGATAGVMDYVNPEVIVTDLDGNTDVQLEAWYEGAWMVVHGHGDNIDKIKEFVPKLEERVVGTTQVESTDSLYNFGGFTDGDRAAFLAYELGASKIYLAGMDLGENIGKFSGEFDREEKLVKLSICKDLLSWLGEMNDNVVNITSGGEDIPNIPQEKITSEET